jgi:hypothetical protein
VALDRALRLPNVEWVEGRTGRACASSTSTASTRPWGAGFEVEARHGDWSRGLLTATSDDIDFGTCQHF